MASEGWDIWIEQLNNPLNRVIIRYLGFNLNHRRWRISGRILPEHFICVAAQHHIGACVDDKEMKLAEGDFLWLEPGVRHTLWNFDVQRPAAYFSMYFRLQNEGRDILKAPQPSVVGHGQALKLAFAEMLAEHRAGGAYAQERFRAMLTSLIILAARQNLPASSPQSILNDAQRTAVEMCARQHQFRISPAELAAEARLSPRYFSCLFMRTYGLVPRKWLIRERVSLAAAMLMQTNLTVAEIADRNGYPDIFQFSKQFKVVMGMGPRAYRLCTHRPAPTGKTG